MIGKVTQIFFSTYSLGQAVEMTLQADGLSIDARIDNECFTDALDDVADHISDWMVSKVAGWLENYYDGHPDMTEAELKRIVALLEEARP